MNTHSKNRADLLLTSIFELLSEYSGLEIDELDSESTFIDHGFDSLLLTQLSGAIQKKFATKIVFRQLLSDLNTPAKLMAYLDSTLPADQWQPKRQEEMTPAAVLPATELGALDVSSAFDSLPKMPVTGPQADSLRNLFSQQLKLMQQQLAFIQQGPAAAVQPDRASDAERPTQVSEPASSVAGGEESIKLPPGFGPQVDDEALGKDIPPHVASYLDRLTREYVAKTKGSRELTQKYRGVHADPRTAAGFNPTWKELVYPIVTNKSSGAYLWDVDGNKYVDLLNGFGPNFLGHSPDFVTEAIRKQVDDGIEIGPQSPLAGEVASLVCELTGLDRATFVNTGSEAVQAAMRVARTVTGKDEIVVFNYDYHGNFDEVLVKGLGKGARRRTRPLAPGIPLDAVEHIVVLDYGSDEALVEIANRADSIAAVMVEPIQSRHPDVRPVEFVRKLRELTADKGIVLVFDEVITGFRTGHGGAQAYYGVDADIATYGKVAGGGMPIGIVAGKSEFMDTFDGGYWQYGDDSYPEAGVTFFAGTFVRHPLAMAAAHAALTWLKQQDESLYRDVYWLTALLAERLNRLFENRGVGIHVAHFSSQMYFRIEDDNEYLLLLFYFARLHGVYMLEGFPSYLTVAHTEADIEFVVSVFERGLIELAESGVIETSARDTVGPFELSLAQQELWAADQLGSAASCALNESDTVRLKGPLDDDALVEAVAQASSRHEALTLTFTEDGSKQVAGTAAVPQIERHDFGKLSDSGKDGAIDKFFKDQSTRQFVLNEGPLVRFHLVKLDDDLHLLVVYAHHLVFDGWSSAILLNEIGQIYAALTERTDLRMPEAMAYRSYVAELDGEEYRERRLEDVRYWQRQRAHEISPHKLPTDFPRPDAASLLGDTVSTRFPGEVLKNLRHAASENGVTQQNVMLAALALLFTRLSGENEIVIGIPTADQSNFDGGPLVGYGVNLLPIRIDIEESLTVGALLAGVRDRVLEGFEHSSVGYAEFSRMPGISAQGGAGIQLVFNFSSYFGSLKFGALDARVMENGRSAVLFDLFLNIVEADKELHIDLDYSTELFKGATMGFWIEQLGEIVNAMSATPSDRPISSIISATSECVV